IRASSLRRKTRLTASAISCAVGGRFRSSSVKIARLCATVTAGVFPPESPPLQDQEPQGQQRERDVMVPAHPAADLVMGQSRLPRARSQKAVGPATSGSLKRPDSPRNLIVLLC